MATFDLTDVFHVAKQTRGVGTMKKNEKKQLPKFKAVTLGADELGRATGGLVSGDGGGTSGTASQCHIDGTDDTN